MRRVGLSPKKKVLFATVTTLVALTFLELTARGMFWVRSLGKPPARDAVINRFHPLRYELAPGGEVPANGPVAKINSFGLRGPEPNLATGRIRVLCVGDSCTFGYAPDVTDDKTYPALLGRLLDEHSPGQFTVVNGGMPGFSSLDCLNYFEYKGLELAPDVVVIIVGWNDPKICHTLLATESVPTPAPLESLALYQLGRIVLSKLRGPARFDAKATRAALSSLPGPSVSLSELAFERYARTLEELVRAARAHRAIPILVTLPNFARPEWKGAGSLTDAELERAAPHLLAGHLTPEGWSKFIARTNVLIKHASQSLNVPLVDGSALRELTYFADLNHLNAAGNEALGRLVRDAIVRETDDHKEQPVRSLNP
jgi:lysophospholipase L1-like esterase